MTDINALQQDFDNVTYQIESMKRYRNLIMETIGSCYNSDTSWLFKVGDFLTPRDSTSSLDVLIQIVDAFIFDNKQLGWVVRTTSGLMCLTFQECTDLYVRADVKG